MKRIVKPLRSGQVTIPAEYREKLGIEKDTLLQISLLQGELRIKPVKTVDTVGGSAWFEELYDLFEPTRREAKKKGLDEEKVNTAIDQAVAAVRKKQ